MPERPIAKGRKVYWILLIPGLYLVQIQLSSRTGSDENQQETHRASQSLTETTRKAAKSKNTNGSPIHLPSKILAVVGDPNNADALYIAESAGTARRVVLETGESSHVYRGPAAPLTSLVLPRTGSINTAPQTLYAGSWDKTIWSWCVSTCTPGRRFHGHTDFVKSLLSLCIDKNTTFLISGGSDACIIIWNVETGSKLFTLQGHARGILDLAIDPASYPQESSDVPITVFSASSSPEIRRWSIASDLSAAAEIHPDKPILQHNTSINALYFDTDLDLWTASMDGTAKCLSRQRGWEADTILAHGEVNYVRDVLVDEFGGWVVTVGRDEEVRVWEKATGLLWHTYTGHYEEVTGCLLLPGQRLVTVGIDRTIRQWSLKGGDIEKARKEKEDERNGVIKDEEVAGRKGRLTEEEERELAELMDDD
ncbi:MAG: hypothetical protein Q9163_001312 [Psora crenata]